MSITLSQDKIRDLEDRNQITLQVSKELAHFGTGFGRVEMSPSKLLKKTTHHLRQRDKDLLKSLIQNITGEDLTGQVTINLSQGGINSVESTQMVKDKD